MRHASLFSGIGGPDLAAEWMGWENIFHCEINPFGRQILNYYWPNAISYEDITKTDFTIHRGQIDVLTGGFPCQPFSHAGNRKGTEDDRYLWPDMLRAISEIRPTWIVGENVAGIRSMGIEQGFATLEDNETASQTEIMVIEEIRQSLEEIGYELQPFIIPACAVDAPHRRDRVWFVAHRSDAGDENVRSNRKDQVYGFESFTNSESMGRRWRGSEKTSPERQNSLRKGFGNTEGFISSGASSYACCRGLEGRTDCEGEIENKTERSDLFQSCGGSCSKRLTSDSYIDNGRMLCGHEACVWRENQKHSVNSDNGNSGNASNADGIGLRGENNRIRESILVSEDGAENYWENFPTQSPVCNGDDGLSSRLDGITFSKWRNESIKAGGNAIVPQVIYEIFKTIDQSEAL